MIILKFSNKKIKYNLLKTVLIAVLLLLVLGDCSRHGAPLLKTKLDQPMSYATCKDRNFVIEGGTHAIAIFDRDFNEVKKIHTLKQPMDMICYQGYLYVADFGADAIVKLNMEGELLASFGSSGNKPGQFQAPSGIFVKDDVIYVSEFYGHRVQKLNMSGDTLAVFGKQGHGPNDLYYPTALYVDSIHRIHIGDTYNHRIVTLKPDGKLDSILAQEKYGFKVPSGLFINSKHEFIIADSGNHQVVKINQDGVLQILWSTKADKVYAPVRVYEAENKSFLIVDNLKGQIWRQ